VSRAGTETMRTVAGRTPVRTVDNAIDVSTFTPTRPDRTPPTVLFVGVVCRRKGTIELARAARRLRERGLTDWKLVVVGGQGPTPEPEYAEIVAEFTAAGLADSLVGPEHGEQVRARLGDADVFVLPSFLEGQPIAIIEAMAAGVPVVSTTVGAIPELVRDGIEGRVVEPGDIEALADALAELITQPDRRVRMGAAIRQRAEAAHDLPRLSHSLAGLYAAVRGRPAPAGETSAPTEDRSSTGALR
jgi:glycosyltransferase involved in cell wall biosynthesis